MPGANAKSDRSFKAAMESNSYKTKKVYYPNSFFNKTSPINNIATDLPIVPKKAKLYNPRSHLKISKTMTDFSDLKKGMHNRSKTLSKISHMQRKTTGPEKNLLGGKPFFFNRTNGFESYLRAKSYSKKQIKMSSTSDLSNILSRHVNSRHPF